MGQLGGLPGGPLMFNQAGNQTTMPAGGSLSAASLTPAGGQHVSNGLQMPSSLQQAPMHLPNQQQQQNALAPGQPAPAQPPMLMGGGMPGWQTMAGAYGLGPFGLVNGGAAMGLMPSLLPQMLMLQAQIMQQQQQLAASGLWGNPATVAAASYTPLGMTAFGPASSLATAGSAPQGGAPGPLQWQTHSSLDGNIACKDEMAIKQVRLIELVRIY